MSNGGSAGYLGGGVDRLQVPPSPSADGASLASGGEAETAFLGGGGDRSSSYSSGVDVAGVCRCGSLIFFLKKMHFCICESIFRNPPGPGSYDHSGSTASFAENNSLG